MFEYCIVFGFQALCRAVGGSRKPLGPIEPPPLSWWGVRDPPPPTLPVFQGRQFGQNFFRRFWVLLGAFGAFGFSRAPLVFCKVGRQIFFGELNPIETKKIALRLGGVGSFRCWFVTATLTCLRQRRIGIAIVASRIR